VKHLGSQGWGRAAGTKSSGCVNCTASEKQAQSAARTWEIPSVQGLSAEAELAHRQPASEGRPRASLKNLPGLAGNTLGSQEESSCINNVLVRIPKRFEGLAGLPKLLQVRIQVAKRNSVGAHVHHGTSLQFGQKHLRHLKPGLMCRLQSQRQVLCH